MKFQNFEVRKLTIDDLELSPQCFANQTDGYAEMGKAAQYAQFSVEGVKNPVYYFRNINPDSHRWSGIIELGDHPLAYQRGLHGDNLAQGKTPTRGYRMVRGAPKTFEMESIEPYSLLRFQDDGHGGVEAEVREGPEGSILDLKITPFPVAVISRANDSQPAPYFQVNTLVSGTYLGRPVQGMGGFDRTFVTGQAKKDLARAEANYAATYRCTCALYSGVRPDGRKECVYALITTQNGTGIGMYYIDGEKPVVTDQVYLHADFHRLPYVKDDTVVYTQAVWNIGPKTIHFQGKWGTKSFSAYPKLDKHGQSQCFGTWYEGNTPYQHVLSHAFNENSGDAYAWRMEKMGFRVLD